MSILSSKERVIRAIDHKEVDRLPRDFHAEADVWENLFSHFRTRKFTEIYDYFNVDMQRVAVTYKSPYKDGRNIWGMKYETKGITTNVAVHPLENAESVDDVLNFDWPDPDWADYDAFKKAASDARKTGRAVYGSSWGSIFGESYRLMGMDNFMMALAMKPEIVAEVIRKVTDFFMEVDRRIFETCDGLLDISYHGNDFGSQRGLLFSKDMFKQFFKGNIKRLVTQARQYGLKSMYHSCGAISEVIDDLIDSGVQAVDPIQYAARGMEPEKLKRQFGKRICFHGGISMQEILPFASQGGVAKHVKEVCEIMKPGSGYIFSPDQNFTSDIPLHNIFAMYETMDKEKL